MNCDATGRCLHCGSTCTTGGCPNFNCPSRKLSLSFTAPTSDPRRYDWQAGDWQNYAEHLQQQIDGLAQTIQRACPQEIGKFTSESACETASRIIARVFGIAEHPKKYLS